MIVDQLENLAMYTSPKLPLHEVHEFIKHTNLNDYPIGRHEISDRVFMLVQEYETKEVNDRPEWHRRYVDIQAIVTGDEIIEVGKYTDHNILEAYSDEKDIGFAQFKEKAQAIQLTANQFVLVFPWELHAPCIRFNAVQVKKIVFKIKWEEDHA